MKCEICGKEFGDEKILILTMSVGGCDQDMTLEVCAACADEQEQRLSDVSVRYKNENE